MADILDLMVMRIEYRAIVNDSRIHKLEAEIDKELKRLKFVNVDEVKMKLEIPIQRIVQARKLAYEQLLFLATEGL